MSEPMPATLAEQRTERDRRTGRLLLGSSLTNLLFGGVIVVLLLVIGAQADTIGLLSGGLTQQRDQFEACKDKPAATRGCTTPVAAEPSVIVKQGKRGPIGLTGNDGPAGPRGPQGPAGPQGVPGPIGKTGPPPGCALLSTACVGAAGPAGPAGPEGKAGKAGQDGKEGPAGPAGPEGKAGPGGPEGKQGAQGVSTRSTQCVSDDTSNSHWLITYSDGTQETSPGPCRIGLP